MLRVGSNLAPLSKPSPGASGSKTGSWRIFKPVINYDKCVRCLLCWLHCPYSVIQRPKDPKGYVTIDYDYCKGCGICASVCPTKAISMVPEGE